MSPTQQKHGAAPIVPASVNAGLCETCTHVQIVPSSKGSSFVLCRLSEVDPTFRRYPTLPVIACQGYKPLPHSIAPKA